MKNKFFFIFLISFTFAGLLPTYSAETYKTIETYQFQKYFCEVYNPMNQAAKVPDKTVSDMLYPDTLVKVEIAVTLPEKFVTPALTSKVKAYEWNKTVQAQRGRSFAGAFKSFNSARKKAEKIFIGTQNLSVQKKEQKRTEAITSLNVSFSKFVSGLDKNKGILNFVAFVKKGVLKLCPKAKIHHAIYIENKLFPSRKKGFFSKWSAKTANRKEFIKKLDKFGKLDASQKENESLIPIVAYIDFPCEYMTSPINPEINGLIKIPNNLSKDNFFHIHHAFNERDWARNRKLDTLKSSALPASLYKLSNEFAEKLFSKKIDKKSFAKMKIKLSKTMLTETKKLADKVVDTLLKQVLRANKLSKNAKEKYRFVKKWKYELPGNETEISFVNPDTINIDEKFTQKELKLELKKYMKAFTELTKNLAIYNKKIQVNANLLYKAISSRKSISNKNFKKLLSDKKVSKPLNFLMMRKKKQVMTFINNWEKVKKIVQLSKSLWTKSDILRFRMEQPKVAENLKRMLLDGHQLFNCWQDARINSFDRHEFLTKIALDIANNNSPKTIEAYNYLKMHSYAFISEIKWAIETAESDTNIDTLKKNYSKIFK